MVHGLYPLVKAGNTRTERLVLNCLFQFPLPMHLCYVDFYQALYSINVFRNSSAKLIFGGQEGSLSLKASKKETSNQALPSSYTYTFLMDQRALYFRTMFVWYCNTINKGFRYISCTLFTQEESHVYIKSQVIIFSQTCSFPHNPTSIP